MGDSSGVEINDSFLVMNTENIQTVEIEGGAGVNVAVRRQLEIHFSDN